MQMNLVWCTLEVGADETRILVYVITTCTSSLLFIDNTKLKNCILIFQRTMVKIVEVES